MAFAAISRKYYAPLVSALAAGKLTAVDKDWRFADGGGRYYQASSPIKTLTTHAANPFVSRVCTPVLYCMEEENPDGSGFYPGTTGPARTLRQCAMWPWRPEGLGGRSAWRLRTTRVPRRDGSGGSGGSGEAAARAACQIGATLPSPA